MAERATADGRIAQLDVLRGLAILGILFMNIPFIAGYADFDVVDPRWLGWTPLDQAAWSATYMIEGTARGLLQLLFGAGFVIAFDRAAQDRDAVIAFARRNLALVAFGLFNVFVLMWAGDILLPYGIAALFLIPLRRARAGWLFALGAALVLFINSRGMGEYFERQGLIMQASAAEARAAAGQALTPADRDAIAAWREKRAEYQLPPAAETRATMAREAEARRGGWASWWRLATGEWLKYLVGKGWLFWIVLESLGAMLVGAALYRWGVIQGRRSAGFYAGLLAVCYGLFGAVRWAALQDDLAFSPCPTVAGWILHAFTREPLAVGHIALVSLLMRAGAGRALLQPFEAPGKLPLSVYFTAAIACFLIFGPTGLGLWGVYGAAGQTAIACAIIAAQLVAANLWLRRYATGPFEWAWKSLAYARPQPFRRSAAPRGALQAAE